MGKGSEAAGQWPEKCVHHSLCVMLSGKEAQDRGKQMHLRQEVKKGGVF